MNSKRFVPCAALLLLLLGFGGRLLALGAGSQMKPVLAAFYIIGALIFIVLRGRIAALWSSSTLLPVGCAVLLMLAGLSALSLARAPRTTMAAENSAADRDPRTQRAFPL